MNISQAEALKPSSAVRRCARKPSPPSAACTESMVTRLARSNRQKDSSFQK